jgi:hypothetical protein
LWGIPGIPETPIPKTALLFPFPLLQPVKQEFCKPKGPVRVIFPAQKQAIFSKNPDNPGF